MKHRRHLAAIARASPKKCHSPSTRPRDQPISSTAAAAATVASDRLFRSPQHRCKTWSFCHSNIIHQSPSSDAVAYFMFGFYIDPAYDDDDGNGDAAATVIDAAMMQSRWPPLLRRREAWQLQRYVVGQLSITACRKRLANPACDRLTNPHYSVGKSRFRYKSGS